MIGILVLGHREFGNGLLAAAEHVFGETPPRVEAVPVRYDQPPEQLAQVLKDYIRRLDQGDGVLIFADIYGATHTNVACNLLNKGSVELIAGVNLPMLIRALNYRDLPLPELVAKALRGGPEGIVCPTHERKAEGGR